MGKVEKSWQGLRKVAFSEVTNEQQLSDLRKAFFAGASITLEGILRASAYGTATSTRVLVELENELKTFGAQLDNEILGPGGSG